MGRGGGSQAAINQCCSPLIENSLVPKLLLGTERCKWKRRELYKCRLTQREIGQILYIFMVYILWWFFVVGCWGFFWTKLERGIRTGWKTCFLPRHDKWALCTVILNRWEVIPRCVWPIDHLAREQYYIAKSTDITVKKINFYMTVVIFRNRTSGETTVYLTTVF